MLTQAFQKKIIFGFSLLFVLANAYAIYCEFYWTAIIPFAMLAAWMALFAPEKIFWLIIFFVPLSINTGEFIESAPMALFLPTEPLLFGLTVLVLAWMVMSNYFDSAIFRHPIFILYMGVYMGWLFLTSLTSEDPMVSFKYTLSHMWLFLPIFVLGTHLFKNIKNILAFIWYYSIALILVVIYTVINHAAHGFAEKPAHWVMSPFFKDHTSYGAILALIIPALLSLYFIKDYTPLRKSIVGFLVAILILGTILSFTRAAWISLVGALGVLFLIYYRIRFFTIAIFTLGSLFLILSF
jgi:hypothetical protein